MSATIRPDFADLLIACADQLDDVTRCIVNGQPATWVGLYVADNGEVSTVAWCDEASCLADRAAATEHSVALPIALVRGVDNLEDRADAARAAARGAWAERARTGRLGTPEQHADAIVDAVFRALGLPR